MGTESTEPILRLAVRDLEHNSYVGLWGALLFLGPAALVAAYCFGQGRVPGTTEGILLGVWAAVLLGVLGYLDYHDPGRELLLYPTHLAYGDRRVPIEPGMHFELRQETVGLSPRSLCPYSLVLWNPSGELAAEVRTAWIDVRRSPELLGEALSGLGLARSEPPSTLERIGAAVEAILPKSRPSHEEDILRRWARLACFEPRQAAFDLEPDEAAEELAHRARTHNQAREARAGPPLPETWELVHRLRSARLGELADYADGERDLREIAHELQRRHDSWDALARDYVLARRMVLGHDEEGAQDDASTRVLLADIELLRAGAWKELPFDTSL